MCETLFECLVIAQSDGAGEGGGGSPFGSLLMPMILIGLLFYFLLVMPERKRRKKHEGMLGALKKNDEVITTGGIYGTVVNVQKDADYVTIRVDESSNTKIKIARSYIGTVLKDDTSGDKKKEE